MISSDQRASIRAVIEQEKRTVAYYTAQIQATAASARLLALRAYHKKQIARWRKELRER